MQRVFNQVGSTMDSTGSTKPPQQSRVGIFQGKQPHCRWLCISQKTMPCMSRRARHTLLFN